MDELDYYDTMSQKTTNIFKYAFKKMGIKYAHECDINMLHYVCSKLD